MNYALQNFVAFLLIIFTIVFVGYFFFFRQPGQYIPDNWGDLGCMHIINVKNDNLQPKLIKGTYLSLNDCLKDKRNFKENDIILFEEEGKEILGVITDKKEINNATHYTVTAGETLEYTIRFDTVIAHTTLPSEY